MRSVRHLPGRPALRSRPGLRTVVIAPAVAIVVGMAVIVSNAVADDLRRSASDAAVHGVEAIVRGYVDPGLDVASLDLGATRQPAIDDQLVRLTQSGELRRINIWSRDGRIVYSSVPELRGDRYSIGPLLASAYAGDGVAQYTASEAGAAAAGPGDLPLLGGNFLELYVPIRGSVDGNPIGVYHVYQDARPIDARIESTRSAVFVVALVASSLLVLLIFLAFGGASRVLARQNRLLEEQATAERLLTVDLQRSEERFRSLVQNASDGVIVLGEDGLVRYASPAFERILGVRPEDVIDRAATRAIHPDDRAMVEQRLADVAAPGGTEVALEFRARHANGSWRTLEGVARNLVDDPAVSGIVVNYRDVTERRSLEDELRHQAFHDGLTGLANRSLFRDRLDHALRLGRRSGSVAAVLYLDLDDFKGINDRLGHAEGDRLLVAVGERLRLATRASDTVARLGGDEFAVLAEDINDGDAGPAADRILEMLAAPFSLGDLEIIIRASIGIAVQADDADGAELLRRADIAMYAAKAAGGDRHLRYEAGTHDATVAKMELKADIRGALERGELHVAYQPIVDLVTGAVRGTEALIRWNHPRRGAVPPLEFIGLAEETGQIQELGRWILDTACRQTRAWQVELERPDLSISVNLSGRQVSSGELAADVGGVLEASGLEPDHLTLEITESVLIDDGGATENIFRALKGLGVRLAIDDFGTGYSSLSYLRRFPVDILKVDRSFVAALDGSADSAALVRSILSLAKTLHLEAVAEGIETAEQRDALIALGTRIGQGHLFARAVSADDLRALLLGAQPATGDRRSNGAASRPSRQSVSRRSQVEPRAVRP